VAAACPGPRPYDAAVTSRTKSLILALVGLAWLALSAVNFSKGRTLVGVVYVSLGLMLLAAAWIVKPGRGQP
jgi:hypothetical protein